MLIAKAEVLGVDVEISINDLNEFIHAPEDAYIFFMECDSLQQSSCQKWQFKFLEVAKI